jgi:hypothetical protein
VASDRIERRRVTEPSTDARSLGTACAFTAGVDDLAGRCRQCGASLERAVVREVRHYEETRLMQVTCIGCEQSFFAVATDRPSPDSISVEDVVIAARALAQARSLSQLFDLGQAA